MNNKIFLLLAALFPASVLTVGETIKLVPEQIPGKPKADFNAPSGRKRSISSATTTTRMSLPELTSSNMQIPTDCAGI
ncbi:hypothetical protein [uncultured Victivallis sp.]|uniref:hypothetical protein n=1 Tax=uncultured Victivallis sp. TaxID=354118 RepID=UPI002589FE47|nr:hypothetical protein [uncultured Victivallis sp.]